jgi:hypothetical protein
MVFFEAQAFATDETPHGSIVHFEAAGGELGDKPPQGEAPLRDPFPKKVSVLAGQKPRPVAAHLPCRSTSRARNRCAHFTTLEGLMLSARAITRTLPPA